MSVRRSARSLLSCLSGMALVVGCHDSTGTEPTPVAADIGFPVLLTRGASTSSLAQGTVLLPQPIFVLRAELAGANGQSTKQRVDAQWRSSDTTVMRIVSMDSIVRITFLAPGTAFLTADYDDGATGWHGVMAFTVAARP